MNEHVLLDGRITIHIGDCRAVMAAMEPESIDTVITSIPYWGLRDYGVEPSVWGGNPRCDHEWGETERGKRKDMLPKDKTTSQARSGVDDRQHGAAHDGGNFCLYCGAWRGQLGLEPTLGLFIANTVEVFREVRRVLKRSGTLWLNIGDTYASGVNGRSAADGKALGNDDRTFRDKPMSTIGPVYNPSRSTDRGAFKSGDRQSRHDHGGRIVAGGVLKAKDRVMIPARVAIALCEDGWWLRDEIIWAKRNPMPSSIKDRTTPAHEMVYLLSRSARYHYDNKAIQEPFADGRQGRDYKTPDGWDTSEGSHGSINKEGREKGHKNWRPVSERNVGGRTDGFTKPNDIDPSANGGRNKRSVWTMATEPFAEAHFATFPTALVEPMILAGAKKDGVVLDPFGGSGTVGLVAARLGRNAVLIDAKPSYAKMAARRIRKDWSGPDERTRIDHEDALQPVEALPLFGGEQA